MPKLEIILILIVSFFLFIIFLLKTRKFLIQRRKQKKAKDRLLIFQNLIDDAQNKNKKAMYNLSNCYLKGEGTEINYTAAFYWAYKAESTGYKKALKLRNLIEKKITIDQKAAAVLRIENELINN